MRSKSIIPLFFLFCGFGNLYGQSSAVIDTIMNRVRQRVQMGPLPSDSIRHLLQTMQADGSWPGIDYASDTRVNWQPMVHLDRLRALINAYLSDGAAYNDYVFNGIQRGFEYWLKADPKSSNWWHNEIATPQHLGELLILMRYTKKNLTRNLEDSLLQRMQRGDVLKQTGANKTDVALHYFYRALLTADIALLRQAVDQTFEPLQLVHYKEGLQYDNSYLQHGPQLQISSYGAVFLTGEIGMAGYVSNTPYALSTQKLELLSNYYRNAYLKAIRGSYIDFNVEGRGISRKNILDKHSEKHRLAIMDRVDPAHHTEWQAAIERTTAVKPASFGIPVFSKHYWLGDYTMHLRPEYSFNVRMVSNRTRRCEAGNDENLLGRYLSDGSGNIQRSGSEYFNIMPVWEWDKVPGISSRDYTSDRPTTVQWGEQGNTAFAGGVSDGVYTVSAYDQHYDSVDVKKAWFFFDHEIVCLGAGISSKADEPITTTINQCWLRGDVFTGGKKPAELKRERSDLSSKNASWVWHDSVGYFFPKGGAVQLSSGVQTGSWNRINRSYSNEEQSGKVFKLWIGHGTKPSNLSYAYFVLPAVNSAELMSRYDGKQLLIVANTDAVQAVQHKALAVIQVVFYKPTTVDVAGYSISTDKPCILMIKDPGNEKAAIYIADPTQTETTISITAKNTKTGKQKNMRIDMPAKEMAGSTVSAVFDMD